MRITSDWSANCRPRLRPVPATSTCNGCYIVLGAIVERIAKVPYERYVTEHVFAPAGMKQTGFFHADGTNPAWRRAIRRMGPTAFCAATS